MNRAVDPQDYTYFKAVDAAVLADTGIRAVELQADYAREGKSLGRTTREARLSGMPAEQFAKALASDMNLAPLSAFASPAEAAATNTRRAALAAYCIENPEWRIGVHDPDGAAYREGEDGQVIRMNVVRSASGTPGFAIAVADDAKIVEWAQDGQRGVAVAPGNAEFARVSAAADIVDAVEAYNEVYEQTHSATMRM